MTVTRRTTTALRWGGHYARPRAAAHRRHLQPRTVRLRVLRPRLRAHGALARDPDAVGHRHRRHGVRLLAGDAFRGGRAGAWRGRLAVVGALAGPAAAVTPHAPPRPRSVGGV